MNPAMAAMEIRMAREEIRRLRRELARTVLQKAIDKDWAVLPDGAAGDQIRRVVGIMDGPVTEALQSGAAPKALELWRVQTEHINRVFENGGKGRGCQNATYHPKLTNWAFLARTIAGTYNEVAKIFMLPHISTVYQKTAEMITTKNDKAYCLHMNKIQSISDRAYRENWTSHQRIGAIAQESAIINSGIEHDNVSNTLKGGDESHCIATLSRMFNAMAQKVKDTQSSDDDERENSPTSAVQHNSILDNLMLAEEHLVFKFSSIDPGVKCLEIVASVNVAKVTSSIITAKIISLLDLLPLFV